MSIKQIFYSWKASCVAAVLAVAFGLGGAAAADLTIAIPAGSEGDGLKAAASDYEQLKHIKIDIVQAPYANLLEKAQNAGAQKSGAYDIVLMDDPWLPLFAENNYLEPLGSYFKTAGTDGPDNDFLGKSLALCRNPYNTGPYVCLPYVGNAQMFFYDPDQFGKHGVTGAPKSWDDVIRVAGEISKEGNGQNFGYVMRAAEGNPVVADFMPIFWSYGGQLFDDKRQPNLLTPEAHKAMEIFLQLKQVSPPGVESFNADEVGTYMAQGRAASSINWPNWVATFEDPSQSKVVGKIAYTKIPDGTRAGTSEIGHWLMGIMRAAKHKKAAFDFMVWATSPEEIKKSAMRGNPPVRFSVFTDPELTSQPQFRHFPTLMNAINFSTPRPRHPKWPEIENALGAELSKAVAGQQSADQALMNAQEAIKKIVAR
ncbi:MAG TPA: ABC transporter substrate-binding protein [Dongiaceae bacterium]|jgi:multiple sugar transport system substrate-binding protein|nr:ABC transporter substrate-binding protein [Dongiaceae bacterium]